MSVICLAEAVLADSTASAGVGDVDMGTVEAFMKTREFRVNYWGNNNTGSNYLWQAIVGGCACFWGSVFSMGITYMIIVFLKRFFQPQEIVKEE